MTPHDKTKTVVVLLLINNVLEDVKPYPKSKDVARQLVKVKMLVNTCAIKIGATKLSRGAERDKQEYSALLFEQRVPLVGASITPETVTQELIACDGLLHSVRLFIKPKGGSCWWNLAQALEKLTRDFIEMFPEHEDWELYAKFEEVLDI